MTKELLEKKLNAEYKNIGTISIKQLHEQEISISEIVYVKEIMNIIEPLKIEEPIIVYKRYSFSDDYIVLDGYHRLKSKIQNNISKINVIVLDDFNIDRRLSNTLYEFLNKLIGSRISFVDNYILTVDGKHYEIKPNEGCSGCSSGWSSLKVLPKFIKKEIVVKTIKELPTSNSDVYNLEINGEIIAEVDTGYGNGYYGGDFEINYIN